MDQTALTAWQNFYVIIGSSAAALTGLQFVVIVLGAGTNWIPSLPATRAFGTPTVVHFCAVLLVSAILTAPWQALSSAIMTRSFGWPSSAREPGACKLSCRLPPDLRGYWRRVLITL